MRGTWKVTITRLNGKPTHRLQDVQGRPPVLGDVMEWSTHDGLSIKAKIASIHHFPRRGRAT
jgi:hypothetical protein